MTEQVMGRSYKSNIYKIYIFSFILGIHTVRGVFIPYFTEWGGLSFFEIMILQSIFTIAIFLLEIPSGAIADKIGRKTAISLSALSVAIAAIFYSAFPAFYMFAIAEIIWGFGMALYSGTDEAFVYSTLKVDGTEKNLPKVMGNIQTFRLIALTLSAPTGSIIAEYISLQFTMTFLAFVFFAGFLVSLTFKEPRIDNSKYQSENYLKILIDGFKQFRKVKILRILCFDRLFIGVLIYSLFWTYQVYFQELQIPIIWYGFISSLMYIIQAGFMNIIPRITSKRKNKLVILYIVDIINGVAFILMGLTTNIFLGILIVIIIVGFGYTRFLHYMNGINKFIESENRATVLSTVNMFSSILRTIFNPIVGLLVMWNIYAFFIIIGVTILILTFFTRVKNEYL
jgi:MFS family permease